MYKILFNVPLRDPSFVYVFMRKVYSKLSSFEPLMLMVSFGNLMLDKALNFSLMKLK